MGQLDAKMIYTTAPGDFFEPPEMATKDYDLHQLLRSALEGARISSSGIWVHCEPPSATPLPPHGWKIHISATPKNCREVLRRTLDEIARQSFHFKVLRSSALVAASVGRWWPRSSSGKFITIYTNGPDECRALLHSLSMRLSGLAGPHILTDRRFEGSSCVHYRYGTFVRSERVGPDGIPSYVIDGPDQQPWHDNRLPIYSLPPWIQDLFPPAPPNNGPGYLFENYEITAAMQHSARGGVYRGTARSTGKVVIIKEARPFTAYAPNGSNAVDRLRAEYDILTALASARPGLAPNPIELIEEWENLYLVEELVPGIPLWTYLSRHHPLVQGEALTAAAAEGYRQRALSVLESLKHLVGEIHAAGYVYGDLSLSNVLVDDGDGAHLVDFEAARPIGSDPTVHPRTPGFTPPPGHSFFTDGPEFDAFGLAALEAACVFPRNTLIELEPSAYLRSLATTAMQLSWPITHATTVLCPTEVELAGSADEVIASQEVMSAMVDYLHGAATPDRRDRLFPADPALYQTNPLSLAYGACGPVWALLDAGAEVPSGYVSWILDRLGDDAQLPPGLWHGLAGVAITLLRIGEHSRGRQLLNHAFTRRLDLPAGVAEGLAGLGVALLRAAELTGQASWADRAEIVAGHLLREARDDGLGLSWTGRRHGDKVAVGQLYGSSGIATFLLDLARHTGSESYVHVGQRALQYDLRQARRPRDGAALVFPPYVGSDRVEPYYSRGGAGVGLALSHLVELRQGDHERDVLSSILRGCASNGFQSVNTGLWNGMIGICELALRCAELKVAGAAEAYAQMTGVVLRLLVRRDCGLTTPGDGLVRVTCDLATGSAGLISLLSRARTRSDVLSSPAPDLRGTDPT